jgi:predicted ATPase
MPTIPGGWTSFWSGDLSDAVAAFDRMISLWPDGAGRISFDPVDPLAQSLSYMALSVCARGYPDRAADVIDSAIKRSHDLNHPFSLAFALVFQTWIRSLRGEVLETQHLSEGLEAPAEEGGFATVVALNRVCRGWVATMQGESDRGIAMIRNAIADSHPLIFTFHSSILAQACLQGGRYQEALDAVAAGRTHAERTGEHYAEPEIERIAGEALALMGGENAAEAEQCMRRAIAIASEQGAKLWELRATVSLARLLRDSNRRDLTRTTLAEIYDWFTEGFDTADLEDAKSLLDDLSA